MSALRDRRKNGKSKGEWAPSAGKAPACPARVRRAAPHKARAGRPGASREGPGAPGPAERGRRRPPQMHTAPAPRHLCFESCLPAPHNLCALCHSRVRLPNVQGRAGRGDGNGARRTPERKPGPRLRKGAGPTLPSRPGAGNSSRAGGSRGLRRARRRRGGARACSSLHGPPTPPGPREAADSEMPRTRFRGGSPLGPQNWGLRREKG